MDNVITGVVGVVLFLAFVFGLAQSIGALPFFIIVVGVAILAVLDLWQSIREQAARNRSAARRNGSR
jgi:flagellin-like protein